MPGLLQNKKAFFDYDVLVNHFPRKRQEVANWLKEVVGEFSNSDLRRLFKGMKAARPDELNNTQVHINDILFGKLPNRILSNPRNDEWLRTQTGKDKKEIKETLKQIKQLMPNADLYEISSDTVALPSRNPGVLIHELGHAIDFNDKKSGTINNMLRSMYIKYMPTLLKEYRGWNKGIDAMRDSIPVTKLDADEYAEAMLNAKQTMYPGLGSYIGHDVGALGGLGAGLGVGRAWDKFELKRIPGGRSPFSVLMNYTIPSMAGYVFGAPAGAITGLETGKYLGNFSEEKKQRLLEKFRKEFLEKRSSEQLHKTAGRALANRIAKGMLSQKDITRASKQLPDGAVRQIKPVPGFIGPYPKYVIDGARGQFNLADSVITNQGADNYAGLAVRKIPFRHTSGGLEDYYSGMKPLAGSLNRKFHSLGGERHTIAPFLSSTKKGLLQRFADGQGNLDADPLIRKILMDLHDGNIGPKNQVLDMSVRRSWNAEGAMPKATKIDFDQPAIINGFPGFYHRQTDKYDKDTLRKYWLSRTPEAPRPERQLTSVGNIGNQNQANSSAGRIPWLDSDGGIPIKLQNPPLNTSGREDVDGFVNWLMQDSALHTPKPLFGSSDSFMDELARAKLLRPEISGTGNM